VSVEVFADAVSNRARIVMKQRIERGDIVAHERLLITLERQRHLGHDLG